MQVHCEDEAERFSFEAFTRHPFFTEVNRWIIERVICPGRRKIVDLGCGPGAVTKVIAEIRKALKPGGVFAFNTTFFNGAYVEGTSAFWRRWIVRAVQVVRERGMDVKHSAHAVAREFLTADQYADLCVQAGFARPSVEFVRIEMTPESLEDIGRFSLFIEGALPGVPLEQGADALKEGLRRAREETGVANVPRNWLECVAVAR